MGPFTWAIAAELLFKYGPSAVVFGQKIYENIAAGRANDLVTASDIAEMTRLANQTGADIYAREGIMVPVTVIAPPAP